MTTHVDSLIVLLLTLVFSALGVYGLCRFAPVLGLLHPPNERSSHAQLTPHGGGLGMVVVGIASGLWFGWGDARLLAVLGLSLLLALVGLVDDLRSLSARFRFALQFLAVGLLLLMFEGARFVPALPAWLTLGALLFAGLWWLNLFNFMDGIDAIAGLEALFMLGAAAVLSAWLHPDTMQDPLWWLLLGVAAAVTGFLVFNWPPARIFMGDVGSLWLAFLLFSLALLSAQNGWLGLPFWAILGATFAVDATVTLVARFSRGERWYEAHRSHLYQLASQQLQARFAEEGLATIVTRSRAQRLVSLAYLLVNLVWLLPLAAATLVFPKGEWFFLLLAYLPLFAAVIRLRSWLSLSGHKT